MRELEYKVGALSSVIIPLGYQGETGATTIRIDFSEWTADGTDGYPAIIVLQPDGVRYVAATNREDETDADGSNAVVVWPITDVDTSVYGDGAIRVMLYSGTGVLLKSATARTSLAPSFIKGDSEPPGQFDYWLQQIAEQGAAAGESKVIAVAAAEAAANSETVAATSLEEIRSIYTLIQAQYDPPAYIEGVMALSYPGVISIPVSEWTQDGDWYVVYRTVNLVKTTSVVQFLVDDSAGNMGDNIFVGPSADKTVRLRTRVLPTGTVSGVLLVNGHMNVS